MFFFDPTFVIILPGLILALWAQAGSAAPTPVEPLPQHIGYDRSPVATDLLRRNRVSMSLSSWVRVN